VDAEQIRTEMRATRASIDRKLDVLTLHVDIAKERARRTAFATVVATLAVMLIVWWSRRDR
jgi:hypothetical protein